MDQLYREKALVEVYDALNASREDFDFYRARLPGAPCRILDVGCGTGSFALELASEGYSVTGVDPAPEMIAAARAKPRSESVQWVRGTVSDLDEQLRFDAAVMTGHAFQCLLDDKQVRALFRGVSSRLVADGSFWFETRNPLAKAWTRWTPEQAGQPVPIGDGRTVCVTRDVETVAGDIVTFSESYAFSDSDTTLSSRSNLRFMPLAAIEDMAVAEEMRLHSVAGDWAGTAFRDQSPEIIIELKKGDQRPPA